MGGPPDVRIAVLRFASEHRFWRPVTPSTVTEEGLEMPPQELEVVDHRGRTPIAFVHHEGGRRAERSEDGQSLHADVRGYTTAQVRALDEEARTPGDRFEFAGDLYEVASVKHWGPVRGVWYEITGIKVRRR